MILLFIFVNTVCLTLAGHWKVSEEASSRFFRGFERCQKQDTPGKIYHLLRLQHVFSLTSWLKAIWGNFRYWRSMNEMFKFLYSSLAFSHNIIPNSFWNCTICRYILKIIYPFLDNQEPLKASVCSWIRTVLRSFTDVCDTVYTLEIGLRFLGKTGGRAKSSLLSYLQESLKMEQHISSSVAEVRITAVWIVIIYYASYNTFNHTCVIIAMQYMN